MFHGRIRSQLERRFAGRSPFHPRPERGLATRGGRQLGLAALMLSRGQLVTYEQFAEAVWVVTTGPESNSLEVHVSRIPQKLDAGGERRRIQTVRGIGYRFVAESKEDVPIS